ncbi:calcyphosin-2-like [Megalops cyprinoides]|uniref:calcyphosin-2-like n=1 Tax=Megalops cyprinoides TaxID=118141 RepID=UPI001865477C|nr:calcyphosin-2-like [Megalops cyprinoides]
MDFDLKIKGMLAAPRRRRLFLHEPENTHAQKHKGEQRAVRGPRPEEVPPLNLGKLADWEDEDVSYVPLSDRHPHHGPPDSTSTLSWGTAHSARSHQVTTKPFKKTPVPKKPPPWEEEKVVPENLPPPSERYRMKYQQYEAELRENFKQHTQRMQRIGKGEEATDQPQEVNSHYMSHISIIIILCRRFDCPG